MGIDISKLALKAARAAIGGSQSGGSKQAARKRPRKRGTVRDHLPPALPLVTGAAMVLATRAAIRSRGGDWLHALEERVGMADAVSEDDDREPDLEEPEGSQQEEVEDGESGDDGADDSDAEEAPEEEDDTAEADPDAASTDDDDAADEVPGQAVAFAPRSRMSPVRRRKLAESAARAKP